MTTARESHDYSHQSHEDGSGVTWLQSPITWRRLGSHMITATNHMTTAHGYHMHYGQYWKVGCVIKSIKTGFSSHLKPKKVPKFPCHCMFKKKPRVDIDLSIPSNTIIILHTLTPSTPTSVYCWRVREAPPLPCSPTCIPTSPHPRGGWSLLPWKWWVGQHQQTYQLALQRARKRWEGEGGGRGGGRGGERGGEIGGGRNSVM